MAVTKKKAKPVETDDPVADKQKALSTALGQIEKNYGKGAIMKLGEGLDVDVAQRIIDFTSGGCYAIGGHLQKVSGYIFLVTPKNVDISGDLQDILSGSLDLPSVYNK